MSGAREFLRVIRDARGWRVPVAEVLVQGLGGPRTESKGAHTDDEHLRATAAWIARAQDRSGDQGVVGKYSLKFGWTTSYPETTGYLVPTMLRLAEVTGDQGWKDRAARAIDFLLSVQLEAGGFPRGEIGENRTEPSIFNTGQIIHGLTRWHAATGDGRALDAAVRAGVWITEQQEDDGSWRKWTYGREVYTYMAYAAGWLARLGEHVGRVDLTQSAARHLEWVMSERDPDTGWFRHCGFSTVGHREDAAFTHTIAYTIAGVLEIARTIGDDTAVALARESALQVARVLERDRHLPGVLASDWSGQGEFACLTGNAQMALIWLDLDRLDPDVTLRRSAERAVSLVKAAQRIESSDEGIRGGIPGSDPVWGEYIHLAYPNWAAKYFIDALLALRGLNSSTEVAELRADLPRR